LDGLLHKLAGRFVAVTSRPSEDNRTVTIPLTSHKFLCLFSFEELRQKDLDAFDNRYLFAHWSALPHGVGRILATMASQQLHYWVRRFIILVHAVYECHVKLVLYSATVAPTLVPMEMFQFQPAAHLAATQQVLDAVTTMMTAAAGSGDAAAKDDDEAASLVQQRHDMSWSSAYLQKQCQRNHHPAK
jgi:predicted ATPase